jgi:8-oxo-dGTP pyrophosphatase MutT (NUDIX family)
MIMGGEGKRGAGFIILHPDTNKILALIKDNGELDLPKGHSEPGESPIQTAKRECFEECSIFIEDHEILDIGPFTNGELIVFVAKSAKSPAVFPNQESGILEHSGFKWVTSESFAAECKPYLAAFTKALAVSKGYTNV